MQTFAPGLKSHQATRHSREAPRPNTPRGNTPQSLLPDTFSQIPIHSPAKHDSDRRSPARGHSRQPPNPTADTSPPNPEATPTSSLPPEKGKETGGGPEEPAEDKPPLKADDAFPVVARITPKSQPTSPQHLQSGNKTDPVVSAVTQGALSQPPGETRRRHDSAPSLSSLPSPASVTPSPAASAPSPPRSTQSARGPRIPGPTPTSPPQPTPLSPRTTGPRSSPTSPPVPHLPSNPHAPTYYSQYLVERHEKFHGTDDNGWVTSSGLASSKPTSKPGNVSNGPPSSHQQRSPLSSKLARLKVYRTKTSNGTKAPAPPTTPSPARSAPTPTASPSTRKLADDVEVQGRKLATPPPPPPHQ